jgi:hypothetical protein
LRAELTVLTKQGMKRATSISGPPKLGLKIVYIRI